MVVNTFELFIVWVVEIRTLIDIVIILYIIVDVCSVVCYLVFLLKCKDFNFIAIII